MTDFQLQLPDAPAILQALTNMLTGIFRDIFNKMLEKQLGDLGNVFNSNLFKLKTVTYVREEHSTDNRLIKFEMDKAVQFYTSGQLCKLDGDMCAGWQLDHVKLEQQPQKLFNRQLQFQISINAIQSAFDHLKFMNMLIDNITVMKIVNTGILVMIESQCFKDQVLCNLKVKAVPSRNNNDTTTQTYVQMVKLIQSSAKFDQISYFNEVNPKLEEVAHSVYTFGYVDDSDVLVAYQSPSWIIAGMNVKED